MICEAPIAQGPLKGQSATGTRSGYMRHWRAEEPACSRCLSGAAEEARNPEKSRTQARRWREANPDQNRERQRRWGAVNRTRENDRKRRWKAANREKVREYEYLRRSRESSALAVPFTTEQLAERMAYFGNRCWLRTHCEGAPYQVVDHVIAIARGGPHCLSNLRPACRSCNSAKGAKDWREVA